MRDALAQRDISSVYRLLRRHGVSQRQIAAATGQSQSEVSEILKGRQVMAYDVLARIADGLGVPRGYMGLAYDETTESRVAASTADPQPEEDDTVKRRRFLAHAAAVTMGAAGFTAGGTLVAGAAQPPTSSPNRIGMTDVRQIEAATKALRALDYQHGGGFCRDAVVAQLSWTKQMLDANCTDNVRGRMYTALADLHSLAGWTSFDSGLLEPAREHFGQALELAKQGDNESLVANILYRMGRIYLHNQEPNDALKLFQLGQIAAQESGSDLAVAVLCANEAWAYSMMGKRQLAMKSIGRSKDEFSRVDVAAAEECFKFFQEHDMYGMIGAVHTELAQRGAVEHTKYAIPALEKALSFYRDDMTRSKTFCLSMLATNHLLDGDVDHGAKVGDQAIDLGVTVKSDRVKDRMRPMKQEADKRSNVPDARDLAERIAKFTAA
ncbi:MAG: helix-turn-helix transcriptional regulator [Sciscionella sp.]|nr:helix-turn-helix transcriptional regulator [Sciscionella sp.]